MKLPGVLAIGERGSEIEALVDAIRSDQTDRISAPDSLWNIDNKYYTAQVAISMLTVTDKTMPLHVPSHLDYQAVVAVFNAALDTLDTMQRLWALVEDHDCQFEIKLAVVLCSNSSSRPQWLEQADAWFAENCTEMIVLESFEKVGAPRLADAAAGSSHEGTERLIEALQAHVWPGMQMKKRAERGGASGGELLTEAEPSIEALLQETFLQEDKLDDTDEADKLFAEVLEFRQKMEGADRKQRADAAAEIVTRLHALMGEGSEASGSIGDSDEDIEKHP